MMFRNVTNRFALILFVFFFITKTNSALVASSFSKKSSTGYFVDSLESPRVSISTKNNIHSHNITKRLRRRSIPVTFSSFNTNLRNFKFEDEHMASRSKHLEAVRIDGCI